MGDGAQGEGNEQEDTDCAGLLSEDVLDTLDAVLGWGTIVNGLEVVEQTGVANAVAVEARFDVTCEVLEAFGDVGCLLLVVGVDI